MGEEEEGGEHGAESTPQDPTPQDSRGRIVQRWAIPDRWHRSPLNARVAVVAALTRPDLVQNPGAGFGGRRRSAGGT